MQRISIDLTRNNNFDSIVRDFSSLEENSNGEFRLTSGENSVIIQNGRNKVVNNPVWNGTIVKVVLDLDGLIDCDSIL